ncbi:hypothetical protein PJ985_04140 [Streptomyces sp. ACA25]|uniref:hypothetical protein n=1 Tax=Streptomyces sp. ACA25 TaxID=3022596 RepID=UPI0023075695|nr:hypothetical protein [Streptomyces sp. ACA25]MDB1086755.1 hypothetical protein [Streptomyces sp. ACA25]
MALVGVILSACTVNEDTAPVSGLQGLPEQICRMQVPTIDLAPLLPQSGEVRVHNTDSRHSFTSCRVYVNDALVFDMNLFLVDEYGTEDEGPLFGLKNIQEVAGEGVGVADNGAYAGVECGVPGALVLDLEFIVYHEEVADVEQRREDIEAFMYSLASAAKESEKCTG